METWKIITIILAIIALGIILFTNYCFDDSDPDMHWDDNYAPPSKGYYINSQPAFSTACKHKGEKTDVIVWVTTVCEQVHTICDDCGKILETRTDC